MRLNKIDFGKQGLWLGDEASKLDRLIGGVKLVSETLAKMNEIQHDRSGAIALAVSDLTMVLDGLLAKNVDGMLVQGYLKKRTQSASPRGHK